MKRKLCTRDLRTSAAVGAAMFFLGSLYVMGLVAPLWLGSIGLLPWHYALGLDGLVLILFAAEYVSLDRVALRASRARLVDEQQAPELHVAVERLAAFADVPRPRIAVIESSAPDAFAAGRNPAHSTIAITCGLVAELTPAETEAVLAHEIAHIANRDGAVMTFASFPALSLRGAIRAAPLKAWIFGLPLMLLACVAYVVSTGLMLTVSRCREYAADRGAALITGAPENLMSALSKIAERMPQIPEADLRSVAAMSAFFIIPTKVRSLTHPPLESRLARLADISRELGKVDLDGETATAPSARVRRANLLLGLVTFAVLFPLVLLIGMLLR